ncbi:hypothetical protein HO133_010565 [Letharia lupina]|uniref:Uncharacterized protein n=1 Tax=Letharia lupina TaxID=560253 RepID=A0A8H6CIS7_9LECA|nr:uncharacterized protein HO133_010565 [Letharia lupina]KAF6223991.1 hypothetical protein HO133_010565 [Letharia lupina]
MVYNTPLSIVPIQHAGLLADRSLGFFLQHALGNLRAIELLAAELYLPEPLLILTPIFHKPKVPGIVRIMEDLEEGTFWLRSHSIEADLKGGEELVDVLRSDSDVNMKADAMKCVRVLDVGRHDARMPAE